MDGAIVKGLYHAQRGHDDILKPYLVYQRKQVNDGVWRPIFCFLLFMAWLLLLIDGAADYFGIK